MTHGFVCNLCHGRSLESLKDVDHEASPEVVGVTVSGMTRARDVICGDCPAHKSNWIIWTKQ